jgi:RNA polymerase sigma-70 factor (ECF subfamily)
LTSERLPETSRGDGTDATLDRWLVADALRSLSAEHRQTVVNAYYLGRSAAEVAREEGIPEGTVRSRMHYALRALRLAMQERGVTR